MKIRELVLSDYKKIRHLVLKYGMNIQTSDNWKKTWTTNPQIKKGLKIPKGWVAIKHNKIIGVLENFPKLFKVKRRLLKIACKSTWVVEKKYRSYSMLLLNKYFNQKNVDLFLCTTANFNVNKIMTAKGAYENPTKSCSEVEFIILNTYKIIKAFFIKKKISRFNFLVQTINFIFNIFFYSKLNFKNILKVKKKYKIVNFCDKESMSFLTNNYFYKNKVGEFRDKTWLNWNLNIRKYNKEIWTIKSYHKNKLSGCCICIGETEQKLKVKRVFLANIRVLNVKNEIFDDLIKICILEAKNRNYDILEFKNLNEVLKKKMGKYNFLKRKFINNPYLFKFKNNKFNLFCKNKKIWETSLLDGDILF